VSGECLHIQGLGRTDGVELGGSSTEKKTQRSSRQYLLDEVAMPCMGERGERIVTEPVGRLTMDVEDAVVDDTTWWRDLFERMSSTSPSS
jgi:hypothetical protein